MYIYLLTRNPYESTYDELVRIIEKDIENSEPDNDEFLDTECEPDEPEDPGYGTYTSCVVIAASEEDARYIHPDGKVREQNDLAEWTETWVLPENVSVTRIGIADPHLKTGVVCADYFAG